MSNKTPGSARADTSSSFARPNLRYWEDRIRYDLYYVQHWSLWFDLRILCLTLARVLKDANAY